MGKKKVKEEYIFDQVDFDKYVEYCERSEYYYPRPPKKIKYNSSSLSIKLYMLVRFLCIISEVGFLFSCFLSCFLKDCLPVFIIIFLPSCLVLFTHTATIKEIRDEKIFYENKNKEHNNKYEKEYCEWVLELQKKYITQKKKEFIEHQKRIKIQYKKDEENRKFLASKIYLMPSWIYFIIRISDNVVRYVGQTINLKNRKSSHHNEKYPKSDFIFEPIERLDLSEIDQREKFWIKRFGKNNLDNIANGGSYLTRRKGYKPPQPVLYELPTPEELEKIEKWIKITENFKK